MRVIALFCLLQAGVGAGPVLSVEVTQNSATVGRYDLYELTLKHRKSYRNPWEDVAVAATFTAPSGQTRTVGGFYYDGNIWKLRFAPREAGAYRWTLSVNAGAKSYTTSGGFAAVDSANTGFLRVYPANPRRLYTEGNGKVFYPIGFSDGAGDWYDAGAKRLESSDGKLDWYLGADPVRSPATSDEYFGVYSAEGQDNMFRYNAENLNDLAEFNVNGRNTYNIGNGKLKDELAAKLHQYGFKSLWTFYAFPRNYVRDYDLSDAAAREAWLKAHKYAIDRWGAYVDIWELMNEGNRVPAGYYDAVTGFIRANDPYQHPITTSDSPAQPHPNINVNAPHLYFDTPTFSDSGWSLDREIMEGQYGIKVNLAQYPDRPQVWGEVGNRGKTYSNYDPERYRIYLWVFFFNESAPLFWNTSFKKNYLGNLNNMYIGREERALSSIHHRYISSFDPLAKPDGSVTVSDSKIHAYVLKGARELGGYLLNAADRKIISKATLTVMVPAAGLKGEWMDPLTGEIRSTFDAGSGRQTLLIPAFAADIVLRIR